MGSFAPQFAPHKYKKTNAIPGAISVNQNGVSELKSVWIKTAEQPFFHELEVEYGFPGATCRSLMQLMDEFIDQNTAIYEMIAGSSIMQSVKMRRREATGQDKNRG